MDKTRRLDGLDGLRGLAIVMVFLNHVDFEYITGFFPSFIRPVVEVIFASGTTGVSLLFILSGFLMAYIYPDPKDNGAFLQKRYTRIFPLFLTMVLVMTVFKQAPMLHPVLRLGVILSFALTAHFVWVHIVQKLKNPRIGQMLFWGFVGLQALVAVWYALVIVRQPAIVLNQQFPVYLREGTITLVNATLTLPLGNYVPMLDGVYWTLVCEVLFYVLYPIVCVPFVKVLSRQNRWIKLFFFTALFPFFSALSEISKHILGLRMMMLPFFLYFATGIALGYLLRNREQVLEKVTTKLSFFAHPIFFLLAIILARLSLANTSGQAYEWVRMFWALPLTLSVAFILNSTTPLSRFFSSKYLVLLGIISYSIYLSQTAVVDTIHLLFRPSNMFNEVLFIFITFGVVLIISIILHKLLEKPYFIKRIPLVENKTPRLKAPFSFLIICILIGLGAAIFLAYQSSFNLLSYEKPFGKEIVLSPQVDKNLQRISVGDHPEVLLRLQSPQNNLGIIAMHLSYEFLSKKGKLDYEKDPQRLIVQIKESGAKDWLSTATYKPVEIGDSRLPFGFPMIVDAKDKYYDVRISVSNRRSAQNVFLNLEKGSVRTVNQINKKDLVKNPLQLVSLLFERIKIVVENKDAQLVVLQLVPFIFLAFFLAKKSLSVKTPSP